MSLADVYVASFLVSLVTVVALGWFLLWPTQR